MSLNHLSSNASPNNFLNPRVNSLVVDTTTDIKGNLTVEGKINNSALNSYGTSGYFNAGTSYAVTAIPTYPSFKQISNNGNYSNPGSNNITPTVNGFSIITDGKYLISASASLSSVSGTLFYGLAIGVSGSISSTTSITSVPNTPASLSISEVRSLSAGNAVRLFLYNLGGASDVDILAWNISVVSLT